MTSSLHDFISKQGTIDSNQDTTVLYYAAEGAEIELIEYSDARPLHLPDSAVDRPKRRFRVLAYGTVSAHLFSSASDMYSVHTRHFYKSCGENDETWG